MKEKLCKKCDTSKPVSEFNRRGEKLQPYCKPCQSDTHREYYERNKTGRQQQIRARAIIQRDLARRYILDYFEAHPCVDCGETNKVVLEFDHVRGSKSGNISSMMSLGVNLDTIKKEIEKCDVRCANCHKIITAKRGGWYEWKSDLNPKS
jgi:hypothetical protein